MMMDRFHDVADDDGLMAVKIDGRETCSTIFLKLLLQVEATAPKKLTFKQQQQSSCTTYGLELEIGVVLRNEDERIGAGAPDQAAGVEVLPCLSSGHGE
jgi:hypothetical protein